MQVQTRDKTSSTGAQRMLEQQVFRTGQELALWTAPTKSSIHSRLTGFKNPRSISKKATDNNLYSHRLSPCSSKSPCKTTRPPLSTVPINSSHRVSLLVTCCSQRRLSLPKLKVSLSQSNNINKSSTALTLRISRETWENHMTLMMMFLTKEKKSRKIRSLRTSIYKARICRFPVYKVS